MFWQMVNEFCKNYETLFMVGTIMASAIIVAIGFAKKLFFNKVIKNENIRELVLAITNVVVSYLAVAVAFWIHNITFEYYLCTGTIFCVYCIFVYWLYKHTKAKKGIQKLGEFILNKFKNFAVTKVNSVIDAIVTTNNVAREISKPVDVSLKKNNFKQDDELDALK